MKQRLLHIDILRGLAILGVVLAHTSYPHTIQGHATVGIGGFAVGLFFLLSGFMLAKTHKMEQGVGKFIKKKLQTIILPWVAFNVIVSTFTHQGFTTEYLNLDFLNFFPIYHIWFLPALFLFMMLWAFTWCLDHYLLRGRMGGGNSASAIIIALLAAAGFAFHEYFLIVYAIYYFCFLLGFYMSARPAVENFVRRQWVFGLSTILYLIVLKIGQFETNGSALMSLLNLIRTAIISVCGSIAVYNLVLHLRLPRFVSIYLSETGRFSLYLYLMEFALLPSGLIFPESWPFAIVSICCLGIAVSINGISYLVARILLEIPILRFMLFGQK